VHPNRESKRFPIYQDEGSVNLANVLPSGDVLTAGAAVVSANTLTTVKYLHFFSFKLPLRLLCGLGCVIIYFKQN